VFHVNGLRRQQVEVFLDVPKDAAAEAFKQPKPIAAMGCSVPACPACGGGH